MCERPLCLAILTVFHDVKRRVHGMQWSPHWLSPPSSWMSHQVPLHSEKLAVEQDSFLYTLVHMLTPPPASHCAYKPYCASRVSPQHSIVVVPVQSDVQRLPLLGLRSPHLAALKLRWDGENFFEAWVRVRLGVGFVKLQADIHFRKLGRIHHGFVI